MRLHPDTWLALLGIGIFVAAFGLAFTVATTIALAVAGIVAYAIITGPSTRCEICFKGFAFWGSRRFRLMGVNGNHRWVATRRCWQHHRDGEPRL